MIEINLVPDVKQELIRAQRARNTVISMAIIAAIGFAAAVVLLSLYVFGGQALQNVLIQDGIDKKTKELQSQTDLDKALTVQTQLEKVSALHQDVNMNSRLFDLLTTIISKDATVSEMSLDTEESTITIEGETSSYNNLDALKKTILATTFSYKNEGSNDTQTVPLATVVSDGERAMNRDSSGKRVLSFSISFEYPSELLSRESKDGRLVAPSASNATDSKLNIPASIFSEPSSGGDQ